jgi:phenylalanine-4-hydroxylase
MSDTLTQSLVPKVAEMEKQLHATTGWSLAVVPGLIPVEDFFQLLASKRFCTSTWVRRPDQLDYIEEPDMFHDTFGHIPPLMNADFAAFMHRFGEVGSALARAGQEEAVLGLQRLYWYFVEFGFVRGENGTAELMGAGIMSSYGETNHAWHLRDALIPFELEVVMNTPFRTDVIQTKYFVVEDVVALRLELDRWFAGFHLEGHA